MMAYPSIYEVCRMDLFSELPELEAKYPPATVAKILRIREMHQWFVSNPNAKDREFVAEVVSRHKVSKPTAYSDLAVCKALLPTLAESSRNFHRWRYNEMILSTYEMAKARKDTKTMERAASSYARYNRVDLDDDDNKLPFDKIMVQPFTATEDPRVLGIEPIPDLQKKISSMIEKYRAESIDIEDVQFEDVDLGIDDLFADPQNSVSDNKVNLQTYE